MRNQFKRRREQGFTLVEILVVIAILLVLATLVSVVSGKAIKAAEATEAINRIRQHGAFALSTASDNNGRLSLFVHGTGNYDRTLLFQYLDQGFTRDEAYNFMCSPVWQKRGDVLSQWRTWGTNGDDRPDLGVVWQEVQTPNPGGSSMSAVFTLYLGNCTSPADYPLFADSADITGWPKLRFANERWDQRFAMRYQEKGPLFFMDGSTKMIGPDDMGRYGITKGFLFEDDPIKNPTTVTAQDTSQR